MSKDEVDGVLNLFKICCSQKLIEREIFHQDVMFVDWAFSSARTPHTDGE